MDYYIPVRTQPGTREEGRYLSAFNLSNSFSIFKMSYGVMPWIERRLQAFPARFKIFRCYRTRDRICSSMRIYVLLCFLFRFLRNGSSCLSNGILDSDHDNNRAFERVCPSDVWLCAFHVSTGTRLLCLLCLLLH